MTFVCFFALIVSLAVLYLFALLRFLIVFNFLAAFLLDCFLICVLPLRRETQILKRLGKNVQNEGGQERNRTKKGRKEIQKYEKKEVKEVGGGSKSKKIGGT